MRKLTIAGLLLVSRLVVLLPYAGLLTAATYYVSSAGSDSNTPTQAQNPSTPWLSLTHALPLISCGDTITVIANGSYVVGNANLPYFPNCGRTTTIQSSALAQFAPTGYRTNPANDSAIYGKIKLLSTIQAIPGLWSTEIPQSYAAASFASSTVTLQAALIYTPLSNGSQVEFEKDFQGSDSVANLLLPSGLAYGNKFYVIGCSSSPACGAVNSSFQLSNTVGGAAVTFGACGAYCFTTVSTDPSGSCSTLGQSEYNPTSGNSWQCNGAIWVGGAPNFVNIGDTVAVYTSSSTFTIPHNYGSAAIANGMAVAFAAAGFLSIGTLPAPLQVDSIYYIVNLTGSAYPYTFQVALTPGGSPITLTSVGAGMLSMSSTSLPSQWAFRGLELEPSGATQIFDVFDFGNGNETSVYGMSNRMEVDRCYLHDNPPGQTINHAILDNGTFLSMHDSWVIGANLNEAQALNGVCSPGPTAITNNFFEAAGEVTLYGGGWSSYGCANANKLFSGNYFYKPPIWKMQTGTVNASGACLYDATDPIHAGGEWYKNISSGQVFQCNSSGVWAATGASYPSLGGAFDSNGVPRPVIKDMTEHKNGQYFTYSGNLYNYSFAQDQSGQAWNNSMEWGSGPGYANDHIVVQNNAVYNTFTFNSRTAQCDPQFGPCSNPPGNHQTVNNLMVYNPLVCGTSFTTGCQFANANYMALTGGGVGPFAGQFAGDRWSHNTIWTPDSNPYTFQSSPMAAQVQLYGAGCPPFTPIPTTVFQYSDNIAPGDFIAQCGGSGTFILTNWYENSAFANNILERGTATYPSGSFGTGNTFTAGYQPANNAAIGFVNGTGAIAGDYHLSSSSVYSGACASSCSPSTDGTDLGADIDVINQATSGAAKGTPRWDRMYGLLIAPGSTTATVSYNALSPSACTVKVYSSAVRNAPGQPFASVSDSGGVHDGLTYRTVTVTGLSANTNYPWVTVACGPALMLQHNMLTY